jgi:hypothetical protein
MGAGEGRSRVHCTAVSMWTRAKSSGDDGRIGVHRPRDREPLFSLCTIGGSKNRKANS